MSKQTIGNILLRAGTSSQWTLANTTLLKNEIGLETDTGRIKIGDGATAWTSLGYYDDIAPNHNKSYTVSGVPTASDWTGATIYVSDETGGGTIAFSDGTNWRRVQDRLIIS